MKKQWKSFSALQIKRFRLFREHTQLISKLHITVSDVRLKFGKLVEFIIPLCNRTWLC